MENPCTPTLNISPFPVPKYENTKKKYGGAMHICQIIIINMYENTLSKSKFNIYSNA
jgi:hypothetical protein